MGTQNYYKIATMVAADCKGLNRSVMTIFTNRLHCQRGSRLVRRGRKLTDIECQLYGQSTSIRYLAGSGEPIYPIGYVHHKNPMAKRRTVNPYTPEGRKEIHDSLGINLRLMWELMRSPLHGKSAEFSDNRISLFSAQWGKCAITEKSFCSTSDIHCHHKTPKAKGGTDAYGNLILVLEPVLWLDELPKHLCFSGHPAMQPMSAFPLPVTGITGRWTSSGRPISSPVWPGVRRQNFSASTFRKEAP